MKAKILISLVFAVLFTGCAPENPSVPEKVEFFAMDTYMTISAYGDHARDCLAEAQEKILTLDSLWSVSAAQSEISLLNKTGTAEVSPETLSIIKTAMQVSADTEHTFDITIYPLVKAWGFTTDTYRVPDEQELVNLKPLVNADRITLNENTVTLETGMALDLGAIAKGYASEMAMDMLKARGLSSAILSLGGNVQALGTKPDGSLWNVAIQDPKDLQAYAGAIQIADRAVITSGTYQRYFEQDGIVYHHLLDPSTGKPANNGLLSVTIVADSGTRADALSTAMFVLGEEAAIDFWRSGLYEFDMILIAEDGGMRITEGIKDTFVPSGDGANLSVIARKS